LRIRLEAALEQLDAGSVQVGGPGHTLERTRYRIQKRLRELER
jgi:hypothetical protein